MKLLPNKNVVDFLNKSLKLFKELPYWKKGILEASSLANNNKSRKITIHKEENK